MRGTTWVLAASLLITPVARAQVPTPSLSQTITYAWDYPYPAGECDTWRLDCGPSATALTPNQSVACTAPPLMAHTLPDVGITECCAVLATKAALLSTYSNVVCLMYTPVVTVRLPQTVITAVTTDSQELKKFRGQTYMVTNAVDGEPRTLWLTQWLSGLSPLPHWITMRLGAPMILDGLAYLPRQDKNAGGTVRDYVIDVSVDGQLWTTVMRGTWAAGAVEQVVRWPKVMAQYVRLMVLSNQTANAYYASAAEINLYGAPLP